MMRIVATTALFAAAVAADCTDDGGNWYCNQVNAITYKNVFNLGGPALSYNKVTSMDPSNGACANTPTGYSGSLSPLDEEVSLHFRGPLTLKQFGYYVPASGNSRRSTNDRPHGHGHAHAHLHHAREPAPVVEERQLGAPVTATIDGVVVSWLNDWSGQPTAAPAAAAPASSVGYAAAPAAAAPPASAPAANSGAASSSGSSSSSASNPSILSGWTRKAYYNAESGTSEGLVFLNHYGGAGSGVFDTSFGNSLSYASADGHTGASSPQVLADTTLASSDEIVIMSDQKCSGNNGDCGYYRDGTVAYHGFGGSNKAFFFEFGMPSDGQTTADPYKPVNMPAIWMLNAQIPRTLQYGPAQCSCWTTGCGEFDIFEVLAPGDARCKSTLHSNVKGGSSDYFPRPFTGTIQAVLIMTDNDMHVEILQNKENFGADLAKALVSDIVDTVGSIFNLS